MTRSERFKVMAYFAGITICVLFWIAVIVIIKSHI